MSGPGTVYLMYHEVELPGRPLCQSGNSYLRYVVTQSDLRAQLFSLKDRNWRGKSVSEALGGAAQQPGVVITFDDGCETDLLSAAPLLKEFGFKATFYIIVGNLGRRSYLSAAQLRELANLGFEIGCHSMTHAYLTDLGSKELHTEIVEAKERLEEEIGARVDHFSCPGGRWNPKVAQMAREADYHSVATSRIATNPRAADPFRLARLAVNRRLSPGEFSRLCDGKGLFVWQTQEATLSLAKAALGNSIYETVRSVLLDRK